MSRATSERAVRKALLQAHAEIERIDLAHRVADAREALTPRSLLQRYVPFSSGGGHGTSGALNSISRAFSQASMFYNHYPMVWSALVSVLLGRGKLRRVAKLMGLAFAAQKALQAKQRRSH